MLYLQIVPCSTLRLDFEDISGYVLRTPEVNLRKPILIT